MSAKLIHLRALCLFAFLLIIVGCGSDAKIGSNSGIPVGISLAVQGNASASSIPVGETVQLNATATWSNNHTTDVTSSVTWSSSNTAVATVSSSGLVTIVSPGTAVITATMSGVTGHITVTGSAASVQSITVTPSSSSVALGQNKQFTATGHFSDGSTHDVSTTTTWSASPSNAATVNSSGLAHSMAQGTVTITATSGSVHGSATLTVGPKVIVSVTITPQTLSIPLGTSLQLTATATYSDGSTADVTSSTTFNASPSSVVTISASGLAHSVAKGSFTVSATSGGASTNLSGAVVDPVAQGVQITPGSASIPKGSTQSFHAQASMSDGTSQDVTANSTWQSSDTSVATVNSSGVASAVSPGSAQITGSYGNFSSQASLTITNTTVQSMNASPSSASMAKGTTLQFNVTAHLSDSSTQNVTGSATWSSSSNSVAIVSPTGLATAIAVGSATLTAQYGGKSTNIAVSITPATVSSITITPANPTTATGGTLQLHATGTFSDGTTQDVTSSLVYVSSNPLVANVTSDGVLHGLLPGTANITASQGSTQTTFQVTISNATLQSLNITGLLTNLVAGTSAQLTVNGVYSNGNTQDLTSTVSFSSSVPSVASVDANGVITGLSAGTTTITVTSGLISATGDLVVSPATVSSVSLIPASATVAAGQTQIFIASATLSDNTTQDVSTSVHWGVADSSVAQVSNDPLSIGLATGKSAGTTQVTATLGGVTGSANLSVTAATITGITVNPPTVSVALGIPVNLTATATYSDGSTADVTGSVQWSSTNGQILSVLAGIVTPLGLGTTNVTATLQGQTGSAAITVSPATLASIAISPLVVAVPAGLSTQLTATGAFSDSSSQNISSTVQWSSSNGSVATVSASGSVQALSAGTTTITASLGAVNQTRTITVTAATLQSITVSASQSTFALGFTLQLTATGHYSDGSTQDLTSTVQWNSSNGSIGLVSSAGLASGIAVGGFSANATLQGVTGSLGLTTTQATLVSISISPSGNLLAILLHQFTVTGHFSDGSTQILTTGVHWSVSNSLLALISQTGLLTPLGLGNITVNATVGSLTAHVNVSLL